MKRTVKVKWGEVRVGLLLVFAVTAVLWATFSGGGTSVLESKVRYMAYFDNVQGLVTGSPVWIVCKSKGVLAGCCFRLSKSSAPPY